MNRIAAAVAMAALLGAGCDSAPAPSRHAEKLMRVGNFSLVDDRGSGFRLDSLRGTPALLFFGYTQCPDACPTMMSLVARAYKVAGEDARRIPTLFVSVDPRDTPAILHQYVSYFRAVPARGLTGTTPQIDAVVKKFGARYEIHASDSGLVIDHTIRLYLLDKQGDVVALFDPQSTPEAIAGAMRGSL